MFQVKNNQKIILSVTSLTKFNKLFAAFSNSVHNLSLAGNMAIF
jgi:hypothetical protein